MPSGYTRSADNQTGKGLLDVMRVTQPNFLGLLGQRTANVFGGLLGGVVDGAMAPGNALAGQYNQVEVGPNGAVSAIDPRMISDANNLAGLVSIGSVGQVPRGALGMGIKAYHGSPHSFDRFDMSKIGTGEGAQAYGHGLYFAENEGVARGYRNQLAPPTVKIDGEPPPNGAIAVLADGSVDPKTLALSTLSLYRGDIDTALKALNKAPGRDGATASVKANWRAAKWLQENRDTISVEPSKGSIYAVDINAQPEHFLDWDKPMSAQSPYVQDALVKAGIKLTPDQLGQTAWKRAGQRVNPDHSIGYEMPEDATAKLRAAGIKGIKYKDAGSRGAAGEPTHNYVVFDDSLVNIEKKYGVLGGVPNAAGSAANASPKFRLST